MARAVVNAVEATLGWHSLNGSMDQAIGWERIAHSPMTAAGSCRHGDGRQAPPPAWPAGTPASAAVSGRGC